MTTQYWALIEPDFGETIDAPGGIFKIEDGLIYRLDPGDVWTETPSFIKYPMQGEDGALPITEAHAKELIDKFPWAGSRAVRNQGATVKG